MGLRWSKYIRYERTTEWDVNQNEIYPIVFFLSNFDPPILMLFSNFELLTPISNLLQSKSFAVVQRTESAESIRGNIGGKAVPDPCLHHPGSSMLEG